MYGQHACTSTHTRTHTPHTCVYRMRLRHPWGLRLKTGRILIIPWSVSSSPRVWIVPILLFTLPGLAIVAVFDHGPYTNAPGGPDVVMDLCAWLLCARQHHALAVVILYPTTCSAHVAVQISPSDKVFEVLICNPPHCISERSASADGVAN